MFRAIIYNEKYIIFDLHGEEVFLNIGKKSSCNGIYIEHISNKPLDSIKSCLTDIKQEYVIIDFHHLKSVQQNQKDTFLYIINYLKHNEKKYYLANLNETIKKQLKLKDIFNELSINDSDIIESDEIKLCFVGLNSCYKESFWGEDHSGFINDITLKEELKKIKKKYNDYGLIVFFHHNPFIVSNESKTLRNWGIVRDNLIKNDIHNILFGHKHKDSSVNEVDSESFVYFSVGSFGKIIDPSMGNNSFNLFVEEEISTSKLHFKRQTFKFMPNDEDKYLNTGYWEKQDSLKDYEDLIISLQKGFVPSGKNPQTKVISPLNTDYTSNKSFEEEIKKEKESIIKSNEEEIIEIVAKEKLIKSGHFHWNVNRKTRTWIDTTRLFSSKNVLDIIRNDFIQKLKKLKAERSIDNFDLIMGLGIEGNIIASPLGIVFNSFYSYYPVPTRNDHNEFEKQLITGKFKNIVLITDVVFEGSTIADFIKKNKDFFNNVENLVTLSVFYTGHENIHKIFKDILNKDIIFRYLTDKIKIEKCNIDTNQCSIYKLKLETIYEF